VTTGSVTTSQDTKTATVKPPVNTGGAVAGTAFRQVAIIVNSDCTITGSPISLRRDHGCDGNPLETCQTIIGEVTGCSGVGGTCGDSEGKSTACGVPLCAPTCQEILDSIGIMCDVRSAGQIAAGCQPCGAAMADAVLTCTDALGTSVSTTISTVQ